MGTLFLFANQVSAQAVPSAPQDNGSPTAQTGGGDTVPQSGQPASNSKQVQEVVVTGSLLHHNLGDTDAPLTVVTSQNLDQRGITTVTNAVQDLAANGAGALPNSFTANGAFAAGASAASLRGLTSNSTLTLIDGMRTAYYPLADDGTRNFVDLNTIPDVIVDRVEVLKDGASSTYGADAIAGVINVITKKTFEGFTGRAEFGATQEGGGGEDNFQALVGHGNLERDGYNVYLGLEYQHDDALYNSQRGYPYNTADLSSSCGVSLIDGSRTCRTNAVQNGLQFDNSFQGVGNTGAAVVRPFSAAGNPLGDYQLLNPAGCGAARPVTITPAQAAAGGAAGIANGPVTLCQQDLTHDYGVISPDDKRFSASFRATKTLSGNAEGYVTVNYYQNDVLSRGTPSSVRQTSTPGTNYPPYTTSGSPGLTLPVYVCSAGVNCNASNGVLNPNNPFAAAGELASLNYRFDDIPAWSEQFSQTYRIGAGVNGSFNLWGPWDYKVDFTAAESDLTNTQAGDIYISHLLNAVATGAYNFANPSANSQAVRNFISPNDVQYANSKLAMLQGSLSRELVQLPGGPLQLGLSGALRYESVYDPSANPDIDGPTERYFTINPFAVEGERSVESAAFELDAPVVKQLDLNVSGRFDNYSTGQNNFSPKVGGKFTPIKYITFRSTYSQGFRIPSFAESDTVVPTTGFTTTSAPASFRAAHNNDGYGLNYSLGQIQEGNPNLKPERSDNFTLGVVLNPIRELSFSFDFYRIKKRDVIEPDSSFLSQAIANYYAGTPLPQGYKAIAGAADPNLPGAQPELGFIEYQFANLDQETTSGYDFGAQAHFDLPYGVRYTSVFDGNYVIRLNLITPNGTQHYAGTIGPYEDVAAGGTPKFKASWQNTFAYGPATVSLTAYFTDGYQLEAEDQGDTAGLCISDGASASNINTLYQDGATPVSCKVKPFWDFDAHGSYDINSHLQFYLDIQNLFNKAAPLDPTTYGGDNYNATFENAGIYGRTFKGGIRVNF